MDARPSAEINVEERSSSGIYNRFINRWTYLYIIEKPPKEKRE